MRSVHEDFFPIKYHFEENDLSNSIKSNRRQIIQKGKKERNGLAEQKKRKNGVCAILIVAHFRSYRFFAPLAFERRFEQELEQTLIGKLLALGFFPSSIQVCQKDLFFKTKTKTCLVASALLISVDF